MRERDVFAARDTPLVSAKKSDYALVLPDTPCSYEQKAAAEWNELCELATGTRLPVIGEKDAAKKKKRIFLGKVACATAFGVTITYDSLGSDGFVIKSKENDLLIAGADRGTLFGVYGFFARALGYCYYAEGERRIEQTDMLPFYTADVCEKPDIDARSFGYYDVYHLGYPDIEQNADRLQIGRNNYSDWIMAGHTYFAILPKEQYAASHPDWYSPDGANLCLTADGIAEEFAARVIEKIAATEGRYCMIGQEDNFTFCDCPRCRAQVEKSGTESAVMMRFSNRVARIVGEWTQKNCPERGVQLVTFAYNKTSAPPVTYNAEKDEYSPVSPDCVAQENLSVMYIPFGTVHNYSYTHPKNRVRGENFRGWRACAKSLFVWDYCVNFDNYLVDFNDYDVIGENYRFFRENGVRFLFDQGPYNSRTPCFDELKIFLHAQLSWNSEQDTEKLIDGFLAAYYKDIAPQMRRYLDAVRARWRHISLRLGEEVRTGGMDSSYWLLPQFYPRDFLCDCMEIFTEARGVLERIRIDEWDKYVILRERLKKITISVRFLLIKIYGRYYGNELPAKINALRADMRAFGINETNEGNFLEIC